MIPCKTHWSLGLQRPQIKPESLKVYSIFVRNFLVWERRVGCLELANGNSAVALGCVGVWAGLVGVSVTVGLARQTKSVLLCPACHGQVCCCLLLL